MAESKKLDKKYFWCLVLIAGVASVPLMTDYVLDGNCLYATLSQIQAISQGIGKAFPVCLEPLDTMDYGYNAGSFQANVFYLFPALLYLLGLDMGNAYKWTLLLLNLGTVAVSYTCFKRIGGRRELGLMGCLLYVWCPYRCSEMYLVGVLGEIAAWSFLPLIVLGIWLLYEESDSDYRQAGLLMTWGFSLVTLSSTVILFAAVVMTVLVLCVMGRNTFQKRRLLTLGKTGAVTVLVNAWFLFPMLFRLRNIEAVGSMLLADVRSRGMYLVQYLNIFSWGNDGVDLVENGMMDAQAMGPGIAVIMLVLFYLWASFVKRYQLMKGQKACRWFGVSIILMILSTNFFPWNLLQNRNMVYSIVLALMYTPAKLGIVANLCLIMTAIVFLSGLAGALSSESYKYLLLAAAAVSFGTTQFLLGNILTSRRFLREAQIEALESIPFSLLSQESLMWRLSKAVSAIVLCGCLVLYIVRRRKSVKRA